MKQEESTEPTGPLISVHVPKTAGSTFSALLKKNYGKRLHFDYGPEHDFTTDLIREAFYSQGPEHAGEKLQEATAKNELGCIHGHFQAEKYYRLFPDADFIFWIRDPVERLISNFFFFRRYPEIGTELVRLVHEGEINIREFAEREELRNAHARMIQNVPMEKFSFIGLCEAYDQSVQRFAERFRVRSVPKRTRRENINTKKPLLQNKELRNYIRSLNQEDEDLYQSVRSSYGL
jgi:hypothetical protein